MNKIILPGLELGDTRLNRRCESIINYLIDNPHATIPKAFGNWKNTKGVYRFLSNEKIKTEDIRKAMYAKTISNIEKSDSLLLAHQDSTELNFNGLQETEGLGYLSSDYLQGMYAHSCLLTNQAGLPYGLIYQKQWIRNIEGYGKHKNRKKRKFEDKESYKWLKTIRHVEKHLPEEQEVLITGDRESDIYQVFSYKRTKNINLLVRAAHNRNLNGQAGKLFDSFKVISRSAEMIFQKPRTRGEKSREVSLRICYKKVKLQGPFGKGSVQLYFVEALEKKNPKGVKRVHWRLLTTLPVKNAKEAIKMVEYYAKRWLVERFHYVLKSGCNIEKLQLKKAKRLDRALSIYSVVAWQIMYLTYISRIKGKDI